MLVGTLQAGTLGSGMKLLLLPARELVVVKSVSSRGAALDATARATAGDRVEVGLAQSASLDASGALGAGSVLCEPTRPCPLARRIEVQLRSLSGQLLTKGAPLECYLHAASCAVRRRHPVASPCTGPRHPSAAAL